MTVDVDEFSAYGITGTAHDDMVERFLKRAETIEAASHGDHH